MSTRSLMRVVAPCIAALLLVLLATVPTMAGGSPSEESCAGVGMITVKCFNCQTGQYVGMVSMQSRYTGSDDSCAGNKYSTRHVCEDLYLKPGEGAGMKWSYWIKLSKYSDDFPHNCNY